jgi:hypothetical protein
MRKKKFKSRRMIGARDVARIGEIRNACKILIGKREGKRSIAKPRCGWEDNIRIDLTEKRWRSVGCIRVAQDRDQ